MDVSPVAPDLDPHEFLQLAGHPVRWRLLGELARSDRMVHELTTLVGEPQNLVSYHLGKLRGAGLVSARRSSADRRDSFYRADLSRIGGLLSDVGGSLHPGLGRGVPEVAPIEPATRVEPTRVLFLCTGNSARSPIAEALARSRSNGCVEAHSAGRDPKPVHPQAVRVMRDDYGIDISHHEPTHLDTFAGERFDWVISLCDRVREVCPRFPSHPEVIHWSVPNPTDDGARIRRFRETAAELENRIGFLLAVITDRAARPVTTKETT